MKIFNKILNFFILFFIIKKQILKQRIKMKKKLLLFSLITIPFLLNASDLSDNLKFNAFGTIGGSFNDNKDIVFRNDSLSNTGSSNDISLSTESKIGGQVSLEITPEISVTVQGIVNNKLENKVVPVLEWANVKYEPNENFSIRAGKMRVPMFINSDILNVNYALPWVRTPIEVYSPIPFSSYNGVESELKTTYEDWLYSVEFIYGKAKENMYMLPTEITKFELNDYKGLVIAASNNDLKLRMSYSTANVKMTSNSVTMLSNMLSMSGFNDLSTEYLTSENKFKFLVLGFNYDNGEYFTSGEYAQYKTNGIIDKYEGYYLSSGYHFDKITPYITIAKSTQKNRQIQDNIPNTVPTAPLNYYMESIVKNYNMSQESQSIGVRYDINKNMDIKMQYDHIDIGEDLSSIHFREPTSNKRDMNVFTLSLDFVF
jgi:hypothetical protein